MNVLTMRCRPTPSWCTKVGLGLALIAHFILLSLAPASLPAVYLMPYPAFVALVLGGGAVTLGHYVLLERRLRDREASGPITDRGLFRWIRHPMYAGDALLYLAFALYPLSPVSAVIYPVAVVALWRQSRNEDQQLAREYPAEHERWCRRAGLWWPTG